MRRIAIICSTVLVSFALSAQVAFADSCANFSRAAPAPTGPGPVIRGNWVWLPSVGAPVDAWGFAPPGAEFSAGPPGANGNYTNRATSALLGVSANCSADGDAPRPTTPGIPSRCE